LNLDVTLNLRNSGNIGVETDTVSSIEEGASNAGLRANPKEIITELLADLDKYDLVKHADELSSKDILIIGGWRDQEADMEHHILPFIRALQRHGANHVQMEIFDSDHSFTNVRGQLVERILSWLKTPSMTTMAR